MGEVAVLLKISVDDMDKFNDVMEKVKQLDVVQKTQEEEIGFGIKVIKALAVVEDAEGKMTELENSIKSIDGVSEVDVLSVDRL